MEEEYTEETKEEKEPKEKKKGFFQRLFAGLTKTRDSLNADMDGVFSYARIDDDFYEDLEEILIMADIGVQATSEILDNLRAQVKQQHIKRPSECRELLVQDIRDQMTVDENAYDFEKGPSIVMFIGVNGVGKTTSLGKLAGRYKEEGKKVLIAAADTFRAAATEQLQVWADRAGVEMISAKEGADPGSVVFDAVKAAKARHIDLLLIDTAGRLHNKKNLMQELAKMDRIITREYPEAMRENLVVLDGTTGQNALSQAREFSGVTKLTGIILTKMDGTAKGGIAIAVQSELKIPVKFIGVGEQIDDLQRFDANAYIDAIFDIRRENQEESIEEKTEETIDEAEKKEEERIEEEENDTSWAEPVGEEPAEPEEETEPAAEPVPEPAPEPAPAPESISSPETEPVTEPDEPEEEEKPKKHHWFFGRRKDKKKEEKPEENMSGTEEEEPDSTKDVSFHWPDE